MLPISSEMLGQKIQSISNSAMASTLLPKLSDDIDRISISDEARAASQATVTLTAQDLRGPSRLQKESQSGAPVFTPRTSLTPFVDGVQIITLTELAG